MPATGLAAVGATGSAPGHSLGPPGHGFPLWVAVLLVVLVAAAVIVVQRVIHSRRALSAAGPTLDGQPSGADVQPVTTPEPEGQSGAVDPVVVELVSPPLVKDPEPTSEPCVNSLGPLEFPGLDSINPRGVLAGLLAFLVARDRHHLSAEQILVAMRPGDVGSDASRKTLRNNLSLLRQQIGAEHLPDASSAGGYLVVGIGSDWATFERLDREADTVGRDAAIALRTEALALVRGKPYEGVPVEGFEWVTEERLDITIARAIARCACKLAADLLEVGDPAAAEQAVRTGLRAAPSEFSLWEAGAGAIDVRGDVGSLRSWLTEASRCLVRSDVARHQAGADHSSRRRLRVIGEREDPQGLLGPFALLLHRCVRAADGAGHLGQRLPAKARDRDQCLLSSAKHARGHGGAEHVGKALERIGVRGGYLELTVEGDELEPGPAAEPERPTGPVRTASTSVVGESVNDPAGGPSVTSCQAAASVSASASSGSTPARTSCPQTVASSGAKATRRHSVIASSPGAPRASHASNSVRPGPRPSQESARSLAPSGFSPASVTLAMTWRPGRVLLMRPT